MATIRKRKGKWQVQVRHKGQHLSRTFIQRTDAAAWAKQAELDIDRLGLPRDRRALNGLKVADILNWFKETNLPKRAGQALESIVISAILRDPVADVRLECLSSRHFAAYRDQRLEVVTSATVNRQLSLLRVIFEAAKTQWGLPLAENPINNLRIPMADRRRDRRISIQEQVRLLEALRASRNRMLAPLVGFAWATGMRRGELLNARWKDLNWTSGTLHIPLTKTGHSRTIPLSVDAKRVLVELAFVWNGEDRIFSTTAEAIKLAWKRLTKRAAIADFHFHDLRHEAVSRFFECGLTIPEVALISGHRDPRMLFRYTHLKAEDVGKKLNEYSSPDQFSLRL